jgi:hypothetical protein
MRKITHQNVAGWRLGIAFLLLMAAISLLGSEPADRRYGLLLSNNVVSLPVTGFPAVFYTQWHPGVDGFVEFRLNKHAKHQLKSTMDAGVYYHRFFQTGLRLHGTIDYSRVMKNKLSLGAGFMAGYLHSFAWYDRFSVNDAGMYEKIPGLTGRPQLLGGFRLGIAMPISSSNPANYMLHLDFRTYLQAPFAGAYIPVIPTNTLMIGISRVFTCKSKES